MIAKHIRMNYRHKRLFLIAFSLFLLLTLYLFENASTTLRIVSTIASLFLFYSFDHLFDIRFQKKHYFFMFLIIVSGFLFSPLYFVYPNYDKVQHFIQPLLISSLLFFMISKLHLELKWKLFFVFFIVVGLLGIFEIGEYLLDYLFDFKLQGVFLRDAYGLEKLNLLMDPLTDTMVDLSYGILGSAIYCVCIAIYFRKKLGQHIFRDN
jgi:hypothetical protein